MKRLRIGIAAYDRMKARTMAIARGEHKPATQVQTTARYAHLARDSMQTAASRITESIGGNLLADLGGRTL